MTQIVENPHVASNNARNLRRSSGNGDRAFHIELDRVPGRDEMPFRLKLYIDARNESIVTDYCIAHLKERGYAIAAPNEKWETIGEFNGRLGLNYMKVWRALERPGCPNVAIQWGKGKRRRHIVGICSNAAFDTFVKSINKPGPKKTTNQNQ